MARRGENIRKRKDGRWEGRYIKGRKPDRTAVWGYVYGHSYTEVKKKMTMRKAEVRACALSEQNPTFQELSHNWEGSISLGVKASTITHYQYTLEHYILPVNGSAKATVLCNGLHYSQCIGVRFLFTCQSSGLYIAQYIVFYTVQKQSYFRFTFDKIFITWL